VVDASEFYVPMWSTYFGGSLTGLQALGYPQGSAI
jgi:hypothetical protein